MTEALTAIDLSVVTVSTFVAAWWWSPAQRSRRHARARLELWRALDKHAGAPGDHGPVVLPGDSVERDLL